MQLKCPCLRTVWGEVKSQAELESAVDKSGQRFGVDQSGPACKIIPTAPCDKTYYQYLGFGLHKGIDIPVATGTKVYAATNGKVTRVSDNITSGIGVVIYDESQSIETIYWHLLSHAVDVGDIVKVGESIGISDNTGYSEGPHLHFQVNLTNEHGQSLNAVDPLPYFVWDDIMTEQEVRQLQALEGYHDEAGVAYWTGKNLADYLVARLIDKIKTIEEAQK